MNMRRYWILVLLIGLLIGCGAGEGGIGSAQDLTIDVKDRYDTTVRFSLDKTLIQAAVSEDEAQNQAIDEENRRMLLTDLERAKNIAESCSYSVVGPNQIGDELYKITAIAENSTEGGFAIALNCLNNFTENLTFHPLKVSRDILYLYETYKIEIDLKIENSEVDPNKPIPVLKDFDRISIILPGKVQEVMTIPEGASVFFNLLNVNWDPETNIVNWDNSKSHLILFLQLIEYWEIELQNLSVDAELTIEEKAEKSDSLNLNIENLKEELERELGHSYTEIRAAYDLMISENQGKETIRIVFSSKVFIFPLWEVLSVFLGSGVVFTIIKIRSERKKTSQGASTPSA